MANIVWIASYPKSGNTWLRAFIVNAVQGGEHPVSLEAITQFFESEADPKYYQRFLATPVVDAPFETLISLRPKVQQEILQSRSAGSVLMKTHNQLTELHETPLHDLKSTAAAIVVIRNPLDVVLSVADHFALSIDQAIHFMANPNTGTATDDQGVAGFLGSWSHHVESWTHANHERFLVIRYEDMLDKPLPTFAKVAAHLNVTLDRVALKKAVAHSSFQQLKRREQSDGFAERSEHSSRFFREGRKNQWIERLSDDQVQRMVDAHYAQMMAFGYVPPKFQKKKG